MTGIKKTWIKFLLPILALLVLFVSQCKPDDKTPTPPIDNWADTPYVFSNAVLGRFPQLSPNLFNPPTLNGVALGRQLFYEKKLSGDNTQSCASCHKQEFSFSDAPNQFSTGIDGLKGDRNSMAIINMMWNEDFFWDARQSTLEEQALDPVRNPIEMHSNWKDAVAKLQADAKYPPLFKKAFNTENIDSLLVAKALAQFMKTITASESKFQKSPQLQGFTPDERAGKELFMSEQAGDCFHCHPTANGLFTDNNNSNPVQRFHNNGLDPAPPTGVLTGRALVTGNAADNGKFKAPTLLNIELTAPYMHDGRFKTLEEVIDFYDSGVHASPTLDFNMGIKPGINTGGREFVNGKRKLHLTAIQKKQLVAFLKTLTDLTVTTNPAFSKP